MKHRILGWLLLLFCLPLISAAFQIDALIELPEAARNWIVSNGQPLYCSSGNTLYAIEEQDVSAFTEQSAEAAVTSSPSGMYQVFLELQALEEMKDGIRDASYTVRDPGNQLLFQIRKGTESDLKPLVPAISDTGVLALADPVKAHIYFYRDGDLISEGQLYSEEGARSLERNIHLQWQGERCYILLERPGYNGGQPGKALFISIDAEGRDQHTSILPFAYLQDYVFQGQRFFISGYDYDSVLKKMKPQIIEVDRQGRVLWNNLNFGHELAMSENNRYLAALNSHESIQIYDLSSERVQQISYPHNNKISLGLAVNDKGIPAVLRVPVDFFVKRNTYFTQIFFPIDRRSKEIQLDPRYPGIFQLYARENRFYLGTNYEWLEITP